MVLACGSPPPPEVAQVDPDPAPSVEVAASLPGAFAPYEKPGCDVAKFPENAWQVCLFEGTETEHYYATQQWPALDFDWHGGGPDGLTNNFSLIAQRRMCVEKGVYFFESVSDDGIQVSVDGELVLDSWNIHSVRGDISRGIELEGCKNVRVRYFEAGGEAVFRLKMGGGASSVPCDPAAYPKDGWNVCVFAGQRQQHLVGVEKWPALRGQWPVGGGPKGRTDNFSIEARTTACFKPGDYVFHSTSDDGLRVLLDEEPIIDEYTDHSPLARDSKLLHLAGCHQLRAQYYENNGGSVLDVSWAQTTRQAYEQARLDALCGGKCADGAACRDAGQHGGPSGTWACVGARRPSLNGEMCSTLGCAASLSCVRSPGRVPVCRSRNTRIMPLELDEE
jgi:hypothetical protein